MPLAGSSKALRNDIWALRDLVGRFSWMRHRLSPVEVPGNEGHSWFFLNSREIDTGKSWDRFSDELIRYLRDKQNTWSFYVVLHWTQNISFLPMIKHWISKMGFFLKDFIFNKNSILYVFWKKMHHSFKDFPETLVVHYEDSKRKVLFRAGRVTALFKERGFSE